MRVTVVTLFPEVFGPVFGSSMLGRAAQTGALDVRLRNLRDFGLGRHKSVDDTPYGGGAGMVLRVDCVVACLEAIDAEAGDRAHRVLLTPQGAPFTQRAARELAALPSLTLICGRYEGFDERVRDHVDREISLGDFVLTGGEIAAMAIVDACARLLPDVLGSADSAREESFSDALGGLLEYPQYTRPLDFRGALVPEVLRGGNHAKIAGWRREQALARTRARRPDLAPGAPREEP